MPQCCIPGRQTAETLRVEAAVLPCWGARLNAQVYQASGRARCPASFDSKRIICYHCFSICVDTKSKLVAGKMNEIDDLTRFFKALADDTRLRLVVLLAQQQPGRALCVGRLAQELSVTASAVSQHLRVLKDLGLVRAQRRGYRVHYHLDRERLASYRDLIQSQLGADFLVSRTEAARETS